MDDKLLKKVLSNIKHSRSLESLVESGYGFSQIAEVILQAKQDLLIDYTEGGYALTELGTTAFIEIKPFAEVVPLDEFRIKKIGIDEIYIPAKMKRS